MAVQNLEFYNQNTLRAYPIRETGTRFSTTGNFVIPDSFIVGMQLSLVCDAARQFFISRVLNYITTIIVEISDDNNVLVGSFTIDADTFEQFKKYDLLFSSTYRAGSGYVIINSLQDILSQASGAHTFAIAQTTIDYSAIVLNSANLNGIIFTNNNGESFEYGGTINIVARQNLEFKFEDDTVYLDAANGLGLNQVCADARKPIYTINGVEADEDNNIDLIGDDCTYFEQAGVSTIKLLDDCCRACAGCSELGSVGTKLTELRNAYNTLNNRYSELFAAFQEYQASSGC